ncbi:MAG TPA: hypothetical protein ENI95_08680 [Chloroflexi bacterium]|nr:hypothetical protein [Chloroflexota bacterium]
MISLRGRRWRGGFPRLAGAGYDVRAYRLTVRLPRIRRRAGRYRLVVRGLPPLVLFTARSHDALGWIDFTIELLAGLIALITGFRLGRRGYQALRPVVLRLWEDVEFRARVRVVGEFTLAGDPLAVGEAVRELWRYLWSHHRALLLEGIGQAVGRAIGPRALLEALVRWLARLISGGASLLVEIGLLVIPLGRKLVTPALL